MTKSVVIFGADVAGLTTAAEFAQWILIGRATPYMTAPHERAHQNVRMTRNLAHGKAFGRLLRACWSVEPFVAARQERRRSKPWPPIS